MGVARLHLETLLNVIRLVADSATRISGGGDDDVSVLEVCSPDAEESHFVEAATETDPKVGSSAG